MAYIIRDHKNAAILSNAQTRAQVLRALVTFGVCRDQREAGETVPRMPRVGQITYICNVAPRPTVTIEAI